MVASCAALHACSYHDVVAQQREQYRNQTQADFWGLREFYALVKKINGDLRHLRAEGKPADLEKQQLLYVFINCGLHSFRLCSAAVRNDE